jgi:hypothetical protein
MAEGKPYEIVDRNIKKIPTGKGKGKSKFWENMIDDFLNSGDNNWKLKWVAKSPSIDTARGALQRLTRGEGESKKGEKIPAGKHHGKAEVSVVKDADGTTYVYFDRVKKKAKQKK